MYDIIADIHGHVEELISMLKKLGYSKVNGAYQHPDRKVIFVGDYIDRGSKIKETLEIVRAMVDNDHAIGLLGNHEYNALCFHAEHNKGGHLRKHSIKNILQHYQTLDQFQNIQKEYEDYIDWFKSLPLFFETDKLRVVHACWDNEYINYLRSVLKKDRLDDETLRLSVIKGTSLYNALDTTLKGKEVELPSGEFIDKDGNLRKEIRIKWWVNPLTNSYKSISIKPADELPDELIDKSQFKELRYYQDSIPVFFGHYWLEAERPTLFLDNICCLDYSVAKNGYLTAYRFDGESKLDAGKFVVA